MTRITAALLVLATSAAGVSLTGCGQEDNAKAAAKKGAPPAMVRVETVVNRKLPPTVTVVGTVTARNTSVVASGAPGIVDRYDAEEGEFVAKDALLSRLRVKASQAELDAAAELLKQREQEWKELQTSRQEEIDEARFQMNAAQFAWNAAKRRHKQMQDAFKRNVVNTDELDDAREREEQAEQLFKAAEADFERLKAGPRNEQRLAAKFAYEAQKRQIEYLEAEFEKRTTLAPFDGFIVKEHSYVGQWLERGAPVVTLARLDDVDVVVNVDQGDVRHIYLGKEADVVVQGVELIRIRMKSGSDHTGLLKTESAVGIILTEESGEEIELAKSDIAQRETIPWTGTVVQIIAKSDWTTGSRGFPVRVRVKNRMLKALVSSKSPDEKPRARIQPVLKEGMMATVRFTGAAVDAFLVHKDALVRSTDGMKINLFRKGKTFAEDKTGSSIQMRVDTGISVGSLIQVTPSPANDGEPGTIDEDTLVVVEGGERLLPVQGNVVVVDKPKK